MLRHDYSRSLWETRGLPKDVGRMINYYTYFTPEEEFYYLAVNLINEMNRYAQQSVDLDEYFDKIEISSDFVPKSEFEIILNPENIKLIIDYCKKDNCCKNGIKNSFEEYQHSFSLSDLKWGLPWRNTYNLSQYIPALFNVTWLCDQKRLQKIIDDFLLIKGRNEGIITQNQSLQEFFKPLKQ